MTRWWTLPCVLIVLVLAWAASVHLTGRAFLPRHTSARDLPYALAVDAPPDQPFNRAMTDPVNLIYPDVVFLKRELENNRIPIWNHGILGGVPHAGNPITGTFYPPNYLVAFFDPLDFLLLSAALHLVLGGIFFYVFLLSTGVRRSAAGVGALGFAFCGWIAAHLHNTPLVAVVAWIPLGLAGIEWLVRGRRKVGTLALAFSIAMQWLAGFPQFAVIGTLALGIFGAVSVLVAAGAGSFKDRARLGARVLLAAVIGLMLAWPQVQTSLDVRSRSPRHGELRSVLLDQAFEPGVLTGAALPSWLGDAHEKPITEPPIDTDPEHESRHIAGRLALGRANPQGVKETWPVNSFGERTLYAGATMCLLAIVGILSLNRRAGFALLAAALAAAAFACGALPPDFALATLGLNVGAPGRAILVLALAIPAFAAFGLDRLLDFTPGRSRGAWAALRVFAVVLGVGALAGALASYVARDSALGVVIRGLRALNAPQALGATTDYPDSVYAMKLGPAFARLRQDLLVFALLLLASWLVLEWARRVARKDGGQERALRVATWILALLVVADLGAFFLRAVRPVVRAGLFPATPALEFLEKEAAKSRFARISPDQGAAEADLHVLFTPNLGMVHDLRDAQGYRDLVPPRFLDLMKGTSARQTTGGVAGIGLAEAKSPVLDLVSVRYLMAARPLDETSEAFKQSGLARVALEGADSRAASRPLRDVPLYENPDALPLAFAVHDAVVMADDAALAAIKSGAFDFRKRVILDEAPVAGGVKDVSDGEADSVTSRFDDGTIRVDATLATPGFIVVGECWDPGWRATLWHGPWAEDRGKELEVLRANVAFMAVWAPAGRHTIELRYWPAPLTAGIVVGCLGALLLLVSTLWPRRRKKPEEPPSPA